ncbi:MAG TPA: septum formation initiator [Micromonospora sp.]|nr:septum formation initiator [Micromonospora sp.]
MSRRMWAGVAGWLAAVVVATLAGVGAVTVAGADLTGPSTRALTEDEVRKVLDATGAPAQPGPPAGSTGSPLPGSALPGSSMPSTQPTAADGATKVFTSPGGSVLARCVDGQVSLDWWTPQQGYQVDSVERGPRREAKVEFESEAGEVELRITCQGGVPQLRIDD